MNNIIFPMKVHAVKLEYRRLLLNKLPHGFFKIINGVQYVIITSDPDYPKCNTRHPRRLSLARTLGRQYAERINQYLKIKEEYDYLLNSWVCRYRYAPPRVDFPISQFYDPHVMNNQFFIDQAECCGNYKSNTPTISDHGELKSKNEQLGADLLKLMGIRFKYEPEVYLPSINQTINPDFLINFYEIDRCAYLEILGMNDKVDYSVKTATKITGFSKDRFRPGREVIYIHVYDKQNFDEDYFVGQVLSAFDAMIPDSALHWEAKEKAV